jgi:hypothetical protein
MSRWEIGGTVMSRSLVTRFWLPRLGTGLPIPAAPPRQRGRHVRSVVKAGLKAIARALKIKKRIPLHDAAERTTPLLPDTALGLGIKKDQKWHLFICPDRLGLVGIKDPRVKRLVMEKARELRLIIASNNASSSVQIRVRTSQGKVEKLRFWNMHRGRTLAWAALHGMRM